MDPKKAAPLGDAQASSWHPRLDYRTEEAKRYTAWLEQYAQPFIFPGCRLLDLGCASGKQTLEAERLGARAVGIDCSHQSLQLAAEVTQSIGAGARFVMGDFARLPFAEGSFDIVLFPKNLIECSYQEAESIRNEVARVLCRGGVFLVSLRDGLLHLLADPHRNAERYDFVTGCVPGQVAIPDQGEFDYPTYFWTVAFALHILTESFVHEATVDMGNNTFLLVLRNNRSSEA